MKQTSIPRLERNHRSLEAITPLLREQGQVLYIDTLNWRKDFPHRPLVAAYLGYDDEALYLTYVVDGEDLRTLSPGDGNYVHEDSCVEFFMQQERGDAYTNFEFNAAGVCYAAHHSSPSESVRLSDEEFKSIERWGSHLGRHGMEETGPHAWVLTFSIPWQTMGYSQGHPDRFFANLYKCGDKTAHPHFLSWAPIEETAPAFHRPQFFGELTLLS